MAFDGPSLRVNQSAANAKISTRIDAPPDLDRLGLDTEG
jgi:hypothetical protein